MSNGQIYVATRYNNGRNMPRVRARRELVQQLIAAKARQVNVEDDQIRTIEIDRAKR